jgi:hypothetical protein
VGQDHKNSAHNKRADKLANQSAAQQQGRYLSVVGAAQEERTFRRGGVRKDAVSAHLYPHRH